MSVRNGLVSRVEQLFEELLYTKPSIFVITVGLWRLPLFRHDQRAVHSPCGTRRTPPVPVWELPSEAEIE